MDILKPELQWIGKRCYRVNPVANDDCEMQPAPTTSEYIEDDLYDDAEDNDGEAYEIIEIGSTRFKSEVHVPSAFYGMLIGAKGATKKRIEGETKTEIVIPRHGVSGNITVYGTNREALITARRRIDLIVSACRKKQRPTHFTCVKLTDKKILENAVKLKADILSGGPILGLQENMFTEPEKLHVSITMLVLMDDFERNRAIEVLSDCLEDVILPIKQELGKIKIDVRGLEIMNDDPSSVNVLYGKVESEGLQRIADETTKYFADSGLGKIERDHVKMHMTLINTKLASKDEDDDKKKGRKPKLTFDARKILENFANYEFGVQEVDHIHLALRKSKSSDGFYVLTSSIQF